MTGYEYRAAMPYLSLWSNRRTVTAEAVSSVWAQPGMPSIGRCLDVGSGDGELLEAILRRLGAACAPRAVTLLEPDDVLAAEARERLASLGIPSEVVASAADLESDASRYSHILAAHVVYYLLPLEEWLHRIRPHLEAGGLLTVVIRGEECDTFRLRQVVRQRRELTPRLSKDGLVRELDLAGYTVLCTTTAEAVLEVPAGVGLAIGGRQLVDDQGFELFLRWMARLPPTGEIDADLYDDLRSFLYARLSASGMRLSLQDRIVVARILHIVFLA
jgi:protein-L-isoaspartate O-methyltransferase